MVADPRSLKPSALVRLLNSTPLGPVLDTRTLYRHRMSAGFKIGGEKDVHLVRYVAWLIGQRAAPGRETVDLEDAYLRKRERAARRSRMEALAARDIGELPAVEDPDRKASCSRDLERFALTYFPLVFHLPFCDDHRKATATIQQAALQGGQFAFAMPRGSGKTALCVVACVWVVVYGLRRFLQLIGAADDYAKSLLLSVGSHLRTNDLLAADFPEVCFPIRKLEGITGRAAGQLYHGKPTGIVWSDHEIVLPTIEGSEASAAIIRTAGLTGSIRGQQFARPDGSVVRPDFAIIDDPQTDQSARSLSQCVTRERIISGAVLGLAGPGRKIAAIMPCTVIRSGDVADSFLDRKKHPDWNGQRAKMVYSFPTNEKLWDRYADLWAQSFEVHGDHRMATEFYAAHREAMDEGAVVAWPQRHNADEISAIQHAMNLRLRDEHAFWCESQNEPPEDEEVDTGILSAEQIAEKTNGFKRGVVPVEVATLTAMIDVQQDLLFWSIAAWSPQFTGYVVDYGAFPEQKTDHFTLRNAKRKLGSLAPGAGMEAAIFAGLEQLTELILGREWVRDDGTPMRVSLCFIDASWGNSTDTVYQFCRQSPFAATLIPSHGHYVSAARKSIMEWAKKPGEKVGLHWRISKGRRALRHVVYDANFWKTFVHSRFAVHMGDTGCLSLFGRKAARHQLLAEHLTAESRVTVSAAARTVDEWKLLPGRDNHWLDTVVGSAVAASVMGAALPSMKLPGRRKRPKVSLAELQARRRIG